jgi:ATP-dependent Lon protease
MHYYLPGWEIPKMRSDILTEKYGLITDCLAEFCKEMRKYDFTHNFDQYFRLNKDFNKRDEIAVRKTFSGLCKLLFPDENISAEEARELLEYAIEGRRRVKEQLKIMAGVEFIDVNLGYEDAFGESKIVGVPEHSSSTLVPEIKLPVGHIFAVGNSVFSDEKCVYKLENKSVAGSENFKTQGVYSKLVKESLDAAWAYFKSNVKKVVPGAKIADKDYLLYYADTQGKGLSDEVSLAEFIALCSTVAERPIIESLVVVGEIKLSGTLEEVQSVEDIMRVCKNAGAKRLLLPMDCIKDIQAIDREILTKVQPMFYTDPIDAAKKALDIY